MDEFILPRSASEVAKAIEKALTSVQTINGIVPDENGNVVIHVIGGSAPSVGYAELLSDKWVGNTSPYFQVVQIEGVTENSQVDLTPSVDQLAIFHDKDLAFVAENDGGVITVYAIGQKPENDYVMQVTITEVTV